MVEKLSLKKIEKKAFSSTYQDGLFDLLIGIFLITMGLSVMLEKTYPLADWWIAILMAPFILAFVLCKKFITIPRMGMVRFSEKRIAKIKKTVGILFVFLFLGIVVFILFSIGIIPHRWIIKGIQIPPILWAAASIIGFSLAAYSLDIKRYYFYGILFAIPLPFHVFLKYNPKFSHMSLIMFFISGVIIVVIGILLLLRFLRDYPIPSEEEGYDKK